MYDFLALIGAICLAYFGLNAIAILPIFICWLFSGTERSEAPQGCPPSAMGSASAAPQEQEAVKSQPEPMAKQPSSGKAEDEASDDSSVVQLPVSELFAVVYMLNQLAAESKEQVKKSVEYGLYGDAGYWDGKHKVATLCLNELNKVIAKSTPSAAGVSGGS